MIESARERATFFDGHDSAVTAAGVSIPGHFEDPDGADLELSGSAPTFLATRLSLADASVAIDSVLTITTHTGRAMGAYRVAVWLPDGDGEIVLLRLDKQ